MFYFGSFMLPYKGFITVLNLQLDIRYPSPHYTNKHMKHFS